jgi:hypothetical protein
VLACNLKRVINIVGIAPLLRAKLCRHAVEIALRRGSHPHRTLRAKENGGSGEPPSLNMAGSGSGSSLAWLHICSRSFTQPDFLCQPGSLLRVDRGYNRIIDRQPPLLTVSIDG